MTVSFLARDEARYVTGVTLNVDGGKIVRQQKELKLQKPILLFDDD
jgi:hypothetical protein